MTDYLNDFVQESEESITELNNALLDLERSPEDGEAMDEVFRTAHTLKGNAGAMGFDDASDLAHALEDLLDAIRAGSLEVTPELMDEVFEAVDVLDRMIDEVGDHGDTRSDPTDRIEALRDWIEESTGLTKPTDRQLAATLEGGSRPRRQHEVFHARLSVPEDESVGVVVDALGDAFDLLSTDPPEEAIREGEHDGFVDVAFGSVVDEAAIAAALEPVDAVEDAIITEVPGDVIEEALDESGEPTGTDEAAESATDEVDPDDMAVDDLLDEFTEYDDLDEAVERVDDVAGLENMGEAGAFDDIVEDEVTPAHEEGEADAETGDAGAEADADADAAEAEESQEVEDVEGTFRELQEEYDRVGLDQMEDELEGITFGEYDEQDEVGFDELIGEGIEESAEAETGEAPGAEAEAEEPVEAEASADADAEEPADAPEVAELDDDAVQAAVDAAAAPGDPDRRVFVVRLSIVEDPDVDNGIRVVEALRDAFDLLGTVPTETEIGEGDYGGWFDAVFGSDVGEGQIRAALDPVDEVADAVVREVTDRMPEPPAAGAEAGAEAGSEADAADAESETAGAGADEPVPEEPDDPQEAFATLQEEYDRVGLDQMEAELEGVTFGEYDEQDEVGFDELIGEDVEEGAGEAEPPEADEPAEAEAEESAGTESGSVPADGFADAEAGTEEFGEAEADEFGEAGADEFGDVETGTDDFGGVDAGTDDFGDVEADAGLGDTAGDFDDEDVDVGEISVDEEERFTDVDVDEVEAGEAEFGEPEPETDEEFGEVEVGSGSDFGEVEPMEPGTDVTRDLPDEAEDPVDSIKGIGDSYAESLAEADVETVGDLVTEDPGELSGETDISAGRIEQWMDRAPIGASDVEAATEADASGAEPEPDATLGGETAEAEPEAEPEQPATERELDQIQSIRVDVDRVDELLNLVEEMVTSRARLRRAVQEDAPMDLLEEELDDLDVVTSQLQDQVVEMRLVPVQTITQRLPRVVRDIARDQEKRVRFETEGESVEVDRSILNEIGDPLIHLVRNAIDHGIEAPDEREAAGKDPEGRITLRASRSRDTVTIEIDDDGRGLDPDELREMAVEKGVLSETEAEELSDSDAYDLIFRSGFSTREEVTDVSGRGVGMDVVANTVEELDGQVSVESEPGEGTTVRMTLPVTVAISEVVFLEIGGEEYGVPIKVVDEISSMGVAETVRTNGTEAVVTEEGTEKQLVRLNEALDTPAPRRTRTGGMLVTIEDEVRPIAIQCDDVRGQQEVVVKPFEGLLSGIPGLSGAAVLGEGDVVNILDVETL